MQTKYCLPIIQSSQDSIFKTIEKNIHEYEYFEIWLDYIEDLTLEFVTELINRYEKKLIFLFRRQKLEKEKMNAALQENIIAFIAKTDAYIDIDVKHQKDLLEKVQTRLRLITSYHEYLHTPSDDILTAVLETMNKYNPSIYKISTYCKTADDALRLLQLLLKLKKENKPCIILGMGAYGMITRIYGTLWGNEMIFAPLTQEDASAPGQLTKQQIASILDIIHNKSEYQSTKSETDLKAQNIK